jgi:hypothetical protein
MKFRNATASYEAWLAAHLPLVPQDLARKHRAMGVGLFPFLRATFYRWAQLWLDAAGDLAEAPQVLAVGDLHVENFGTWRDHEGRLVWGINDFDEACHLPYTNDLVRLAASAQVAIAEHRLSIGPASASDLILEGYRESLASGGRPFVLAEEHPELRAMAEERLHEPERFWRNLEKLPTMRRLPGGVVEVLAGLLPDPQLECRYVHRTAGLGSLGRRRVVAIGKWQGGKIAREAKELAPSAWLWATGKKSRGSILYQEIMTRAVRCIDPFAKVKRRWIVRRLAPDCSRIDLSALPKAGDMENLLHAMGWETANVHLGTGKARAIRADLGHRPRKWLYDGARRMVELLEEDWESWR